MTTPANVPVELVYNKTWEEEFTYLDENGDPVDLSAYEARLQVRAQASRYGTTGTAVIDKNTEDDTTEIFITTSSNPDYGTVACAVRVKIAVADVNLTNPTNARVLRGSYRRGTGYGYGIELYKPLETPEYVVPLSEGDITTYGSTVR